MVFIEATTTMADAERTIPNKASTVKIAGAGLVSNRHPTE